MLLSAMQQAAWKWFHQLIQKQRGKFLGYMKEDSVRHILVWFDLFWFRKTWEDHVEALEAFGIEVKAIEPKE